LHDANISHRVARETSFETAVTNFSFVVANNGGTIGFRRDSDVQCE